MISIRKLWEADDENTQAILRAIQLLLRAMVFHAVEGDPADYGRFRDTLMRIADAIPQNVSASGLVAQAGEAAKALEEYNRCTSRFLDLRAFELQGIIHMLTATIEAVATAGEESVRRLREIEDEVRNATQIEDVRMIKAKLSECLDKIRIEAECRRAETSTTVESLRGGLRQAQNTSVAGDARDAVTGLLGRACAEHAIKRFCRPEVSAFAVVLVVDRVHVATARFGRRVGDNLLREYARFLLPQLRPADELFRWTGPVLLALVHRAEALDYVRKEVSRIVENKYEFTIETPVRTTMLPVSARYTVLPMMASPRLLIQKIDIFCNSANSPQD